MSVFAEVLINPSRFTVKSLRRSKGVIVRSMIMTLTYTEVIYVKEIFSLNCVLIFIKPFHEIMQIIWINQKFQGGHQVLIARVPYLDSYLPFQFFPSKIFIPPSSRHSWVHFCFIPNRRKNWDNLCFCVLLSTTNSWIIYWVN